MRAEKNKARRSMHPAARQHSALAQTSVAQVQRFHGGSIASGPGATATSGSGKSLGYSKPAMHAPARGATQKSHSWANAAPPTTTAGPVERAGLTDVFVTGMEMR